ncbi:tetratricopeptide repeat protein [Streptomyces sp. NPDC002690]
MNVDDLEWQYRHLGGVFPRTVESLLANGHLDLVVRAARERGDWFCARAAARELCATEDFERAWGVMKPFTESGWPPALSAGADILLRWGRVEEALARVLPDGAAQDVPGACQVYAEVLVAAGRVDEAITVLEPHLAEGRLLSSLVRMTEGQGRDDRILRLLTTLVDKAGQDRAVGMSDPLWAVPLLRAQVLERSGRVDEAVRVLGAAMAGDRVGCGNTAEGLAELLARHGRIEDLRQSVAAGHGRWACQPLVTALEGSGRADEAEAMLREWIGAGGAEYPGGLQSLLMELLARQGRTDDAVESVRSTFEDVWEGLLQPAALMLAEHGLHDRALELLEERTPEFLAESAHWVPSTRWWLMGESGRCAEAIAEVEAASGLEPGERDTTVAQLLVRDGRADEAIALLGTSTRSFDIASLADLLIEQHRPAEALAAIPGVAAQRREEDSRWRAFRREADPGERAAGLSP